MPVTCVGINHRTAPLARLEDVALSGLDQRCDLVLAPVQQVRRL
jgi:hypothetical protein